MDKLTIIKQIVYSFIEDAKVQLETNRCSRINYNCELNKSGIILNIKLNFFGIAIKEQKDVLLKSIEENWRPTASKYHGILFSILHELGHYYTLVGLDNNAINKEYDYVNNNYFDFDRANVAYHQISCEKLADAWAINWLESFPMTAKRFSMMLERVY